MQNLKQLYIDPPDIGNFYWRFVLVFSCIPCILRFLLVTLIFRDDTPLYYMLNGQEETAQEVLAKTYHPEFI